MGIPSKRTPEIGYAVLMTKANALLPTERTALIFAILLFPGFFLYHFAIARGFIPAFMGGWFGPIALACFALFFWASLSSKIKRTRITRIEVIFLSILVLHFLTVIGMYAWGYPETLADEVFKSGLQSGLYLFVMYLIGKNISLTTVKTLGYLVLPLAIITITNVGPLGQFYVALEAQGGEIAVASYQGFARSLLIGFFCALVVFQNRPVLHIMVVALGAVVLFLNGSRTEFVLFLASYTSLQMFRLLFNQRLKRAFLAFLIVGPLILAGLFRQLSTSRMSGLAQIFSSTSSQGRSQIMEHVSSEVFSTFPKAVFGSYAAYVGVSNGLSNAHNLFSAWVDLGLLGFSIYIIMMILAWVEAFRLYPRMKMDIQFNLFLLLLFYATPALIFSKGYTHMLVGLMIGVLSAVYKNMRST